MSLDIQDEEINATTHLITLGGEVDLYTAPAFGERVIELIESGKKHIVVDLSRGTYLDDSHVLRVLRESEERLRSTGGSITLVCAPEPVRKVFEITGLDQVFPIYSSRNAALAALEYPTDHPEADGKEPAALVGITGGATPGQRGAERAADERREDPEVAHAWRDVEKAWRKLEKAERAAGNVPFKAQSSPEQALAEAGRSPPGVGQLLRAKAEFEQAIAALRETEQRVRERREMAEADTTWGAGEAGHDEWRGFDPNRQESTADDSWPEDEADRHEAEGRGWRWTWWVDGSYTGLAVLDASGYVLARGNAARTRAYEQDETAARHRRLLRALPGEEPGVTLVELEEALGEDRSSWYQALVREVESGNAVRTDDARYRRTVSGLPLWDPARVPDARSVDWEDELDYVVWQALRSEDRREAQRIRTRLRRVKAALVGGKEPSLRWLSGRRARALADRHRRGRSGVFAPDFRGGWPLAPRGSVFQREGGRER